MARKGETWNESEVYKDAWTLRQVRRVTTRGLYNQTPTYHTDIGFTADGEFFVFASKRDGESAVFRCHVPTGDITQLIEPVRGVNITGVSLCLAPRSHWAVFVAGRSLRAVNITTLEERVLVEEFPAGWQTGVPSIDCEEKSVVLPAFPAPPANIADNAPAVWEYFTTRGGVWLKLLRVPLDGGGYEVVYEEDGCRSAHCPHSPVDPDLLLLDRDFPPHFWGGSDGKTNRIWAFNLATKTLTELPPQDKARFQVHSCWTWDGQAIIYHGRSAVSGYYIGLVDKNGHTIREYPFYGAPHYGHVAAMAGRPAIILDGNISPDLLLWLYYDDEQPRVEVIARHGSDWQSLGGQFPHPHPLSDPTGRWISFNAGSGGRTDVFVVRV